jgi:hypothetical protein
MVTSRRVVIACQPILFRECHCEYPAESQRSASGGSSAEGSARSARCSVRNAGIDVLFDPFDAH